MLYRLPTEIVDRLILPLGDIDEKEKVRDLVRDFGVFNADDKDSQEICFIPDDDYVKYLEQRGIFAKEGDFIDERPVKPLESIAGSSITPSVSEKALVLPSENLGLSQRSIP